MLCEKCKKNVATFHYSEVLNGVKNEHHLCNDCAANTDLSYYSKLFDGEMNFTQLLSGLLGGGAVKNSEQQTDVKENIQCPTCGMTYGEFVKKSTFGCSDCYDVFGPLITDTIKRLQGNDTHIGKKPMVFSDNIAEVNTADTSDSAEPDYSREIDILSKKLREAVLIEDFDEAARLRDSIAELRSKEVKGNE